MKLRRKLLFTFITIFILGICTELLFYFIRSAGHSRPVSYLEADPDLVWRLKRDFPHVNEIGC